MTDTTLNKVNSRAEDVYLQIKTAILYGHQGFLPGELLNENKLAEFFKVSKTPVREALNRLRYENLIEVIPYKGYFVSNLSYKDMVDLFQLRFILETGAVELAVKNITLEQLSVLKQLTEQSVSEETDDMSLRFRQLNLDFHTLVAEASGNGWLMESVKKVVEQMQRALFLNFSISEVEEHQEEHRKLVKAIEKKEIELAKECMKDQIESAKARIMRTSR